MYFISLHSILHVFLWIHGLSCFLTVNGKSVHGCYIERMGGILWYVMSIAESNICFDCLFSHAQSAPLLRLFLYYKKGHNSKHNFTYQGEETVTLVNNLELSFQGSLLLSSQNHPYVFYVWSQSLLYLAGKREGEGKKKKERPVLLNSLSLQMSALNLLTGSATTGPTLTRLPHNLRYFPEWR